MTDPARSFNPGTGSGPCWACTHYRGMVHNDIARCGREGASPVKAQAERGCAFFEREPGADDESPAGGDKPRAP